MFALVRNRAGSKQLLEYQRTAPNVHILEADIADVPALKVSTDDILLTLYYHC